MLFINKQLERRGCFGETLGSHGVCAHFYSLAFFCWLPLRKTVKQELKHASAFLHAEQYHRV
jgi:hypothetical protein